MRIRTETTDDHAAVRAVNVAAFETEAEAELVARLREQASPLISLVAEIDAAVVGHIAFSPASLSAAPELRAMGLGPMAVLPDFQRRGIGSALVTAGLDACKDLGYQAVFVLGHPEYYPRFGFVPASRFGIKSVYRVPDEVFMALELVAGALAGKPGVLHYHESFGE